jgi:UDPglucose 6-dehydrogenase
VGKKVAVIGGGYVGLTTAAALAHLGNEVTVVEVDRQRLDCIRSGRPPFHEPGLAQLLAAARPRLHVTDDAVGATACAEIVFVCVGTPSGPDGSTDLSQLVSAATAIRTARASGDRIVVNKSTVPVGSGYWVHNLADNGNGHLAVVSNPEFLREGSAIVDTFRPDRVVVGADSEQAADRLLALYAPIIEQDVPEIPSYPLPASDGRIPVLKTDLITAELIKYAANAFLATKISFINEVARLCERVGADVRLVADGIGMDERIGRRFLDAGLGWGGSCFGKDLAAIIATAAEYGDHMPILEAVRSVNLRQRMLAVEKLQSELRIVKGRRIALWGLSFKPHTDDLRDAPAMDVARRLLALGATVIAFDPVVTRGVPADLVEAGLRFAADPFEAARGADAIVLCTEWPVFLEQDPERLAGVMARPLVIDGRNALEKARYQAAGFTYRGFGR